MAQISDLKARSIKPDDKPIAHGGVTGLLLYPSSTKGRGKWLLRYASPISKKRRMMGLGAYPEVGISQAGKLAIIAREKIAAGIDPLDEKEEVRETKTIPLFRDAAQTLHNELKPSWKNKKHAAQWITTIEEYANPHIGNMRLDKILPKHIADVLRPIWLTKSETASRLKQRIHAVMAWGWAQEYCQSNPVDVVMKLLPVQESKTTRVEHQPAMPWRILPMYVKDYLLVEQSRASISKSMMVFLILTAARSGEVRGATWKEIDFEQKIWSIPAERMKTKVAHRVPLSDQAIDLLRRLQGIGEDLIFPSPVKGTMLSDMALTKLLRISNAVSDNPERVATAHGFRSSFRDWCSENGYAENLAERSLAHVIRNKVEAAYHRTDLLEQRRPLMQAWGDYVMSGKAGV